VAQEGCRKGDNLHFFFSGNRVLLCTLGWSLTHDCPASASLVCAGITAVCHTQLEFKDLFLNFNLFSTNGKGVFVLLCVVVITKCDLCGCKGMVVLEHKMTNVFMSNLSREASPWAFLGQSHKSGKHELLFVIAPKK
jgi:hypothetical protein